jgi:hypothetical protein
MQALHHRGVRPRLLVVISAGTFLALAAGCGSRGPTPAEAQGALRVVIENRQDRPLFLEGNDMPFRLVDAAGASVLALPPPFGLPCGYCQAYCDLPVQGEYAPTYLELPAGRELVARWDRQAYSNLAQGACGCDQACHEARPLVPGTYRLEVPYRTELPDGGRDYNTQPLGEGPLAGEGVVRRIDVKNGFGLTDFSTGGVENVEVRYDASTRELRLVFHPELD